VKIIRTAASLILLVLPPTYAEFHPRQRVPASQHASAVTLRKRLHVNDLITQPGTVELDWGTLYSYATGSFTFPSALKFTPLGNSLFWGRTEYSVAFNSLASTVDTGVRLTQFSDRLTFAATSVVFDSPHFDIALAPQVTAFLRDDSGTRLGATAIGRYDAGGNSIGISLSWTAASSATDTNPAGVWDFGGGYSRRLGSVFSRFTPHLNAVLEKSTGFERSLSVFAGVEYQMTERVAIDATGQRSSLTGGTPDRQVLLGFTINLGKQH
jgi:hypothetical protein